jgi:metal-dependent hydrolase (beta-lactamase superfamily II)
MTAYLVLTFFLDEESNKEIKAICQPEFFALMFKCMTHLTKNSGSHQIAVCHRTIQDVTRIQKDVIQSGTMNLLTFNRFIGAPHL